MTVAGLLSTHAAAQEIEKFQAELDRARQAMKSVDMDQVRRDMERAQEALQKANLDDLQLQLHSMPMPAVDWGNLLNLAQIAPPAPVAPRGGVIGGIAGGITAPLLPGFAFAPQSQSERAQEAAERAREQAERVRDQKERVRETEDRFISWYRDGTNSVDEHRYERAIDYFNRVIEGKWNRADGALYWKAYALNKLGKREEALAALAEIPKQFPQSRWINDAKALQVEIQQASGQPASPESMSDEDLKLLAIQSLVSSEPEKAVPLLATLINDPKTNLSIKGRALYVLAQSRSDKAREIVAQYAKNGANQDLQIRAVGYIGSFRMPNSAQILGEVYSSTNDPAVRRAVLRGMANARDAAHLLNAAKTEQNQDLRREAIRGLGNMQASNELAQLYTTETNNELKQAIIDSIANARGVDKLIEIARSEKDPELRAYAIRRLGFMRSPQPGTDKASEALVAIYKSESDKAVKTNIIRALAQGGACAQLVDLMRNEKDTEVKAQGVRYLGQMRGCKEATDFLMEVIAK